MMGGGFRIMLVDWVVGYRIGLSEFSNNWKIRSLDIHGFPNTGTYGTKLYFRGPNPWVSKGYHDIIGIHRWLYSYSYGTLRHLSACKVRE